MSASGRARLLALAVVVAGAAGGCATLATWRKCGAGCPGDAGISAAVRARLYQHTELLAPNRVYVSTLDGVVYLSGEVVTDTQRLDAEDIARATPGVTRVVDVISLEFQGR
ncbi:MAG TPA: BON domain-containing protein [Gemmatimonadales bacterium]|jgi:osmotically-inducible protein OsmY|nr:BON domain-containing protein [Gemmatimonadales bacterium]